MPRTNSRATKSSKTATRKSSAKTAAATTTTAKKTAASKTSRTPFGTYTVAKKHVSVAVPPYWRFRQTNEDLELDAPSGNTSVIITAYQKNGRSAALDAREYLDHFLANIPAESRITRDGSTKQRASARYRDDEGNSWLVSFLTNGKTLLLAELSTAGPLTGKEARTALEVMSSVKLGKE